MNLLDYYQNLSTDENERDILCLLFNSNHQQFLLGCKQFSKIISTHVGERDLIRLIRDIFPILIKSDAFILDNNVYLNPNDALHMVDSVLYLEILFEEFLKKSGRRGFFISHFKAISHEWSYFSYEFILCKADGISIKDLLALSIGLKKYDLNVISKWDKTKRVNIYIAITRKDQVGIFQDGSFLGFKSHKKINDVEDILQIIFGEINSLSNYFFKKSGPYFELYGEIPGIKELPIRPTPKVSKIPSKIETAISPLEKNLRILKIKELPKSKKELKKIFYRLAMTAHPDKFEHVDKGTQTELAIVDNFREIHSAYEFIENEIEKIYTK